MGEGGGGGVRESGIYIYIYIYPRGGERTREGGRYYIGNGKRGGGGGKRERDVHMYIYPRGERERDREGDII